MSGGCTGIEEKRREQVGQDGDRRMRHYADVLSVSKLCQICTAIDAVHTDRSFDWSQPT